MGDLSPFQHPRFARMYEQLSERADRRGSAEHRARLLAGLTGRVVEVGAGNGRNFAHYPRTVTEVVAVEPEDRLRARAQDAASEAEVRITVVAGHGDALPARDGEFDAAVVSLVLCSVPDPGITLAEIRRILRPGGELRFYEHVRSTVALLGLLEDLITPLWARAGGGCHPNRDTATAIRDAGFVIDTVDRFTFRPVPLMPPSAHILGGAHSPHPAGRVPAAG